MTFFGATLITAIATGVLALFAIVTAWYARRAFLKQSREVAAIEQQVSDQKELTARQADLLRLQGEQLDLQRRQFDQEQHRRRRDQASRIFVWTETGTNPAVNQAQRVTTPGNYDVVIAYVQNTSQEPIYDLTISWRQGVARWSEPTHLPVLLPGPLQDFMRSLPDELPPGIDRSVFSAVVIFRDRDQVWWRTRPGGKFEELEPGAEPPHSW